MILWSITVRNSLILSYLLGFVAVPKRNATSKSVREGIHTNKKNSVPQVDPDSNLESASIVEDFDTIFQTSMLKSSSRN